MSRLKVVTHRGRLDRELAAGADPSADEALALRAAQLERPASRAELAMAIERILDAADAPPTFRASAPLNRPAIRATRCPTFSGEKSGASSSRPAATGRSRQPKMAFSRG